MNVYDQAHGLAHAIKASEEYKQYDEAKKKLKENPELEKMIKERNKGIYDAVIIDPSATGLINELKIRGIAVKKAINDVGKRRQKEQPDKKIDKSITGIWLVRDGFAKKKIFIHYKMYFMHKYASNCENML